MGGCNFGKILQVNVPKCHSGRFTFLIETFPNLSELYNLKPSFHPSIAANVEAINSLIRECHIYSKSCMTVTKTRKTQEGETYFANERSGLAKFISDLGCLRKHCWQKIWSDFERKITSQTRYCLEHCQFTLSHDIHRPD